MLDGGAKRPGVEVTGRRNQPRTLSFDHYFKYTLGRCEMRLEVVYSTKWKRQRNSINDCDFSEFAEFVGYFVCFVGVVHQNLWYA